MSLKIRYDNGREKDVGFIYVASRDVLYYELALISCQTLRDYYPDAHVTLFTHENFVDEEGRAEELFDTIITDIPIHYRTKMWCMARTPYTKRTIYIDADSMIRHRDIKKMHDFLDECDLFCGSNLLYTVGNPKWAHIDKARKYEPIYHGSMWGYHTTDLNLDFMQTWFDEYVKQRRTKWPHEKFAYREWQQFDMFTLWTMTVGSRIGMFPQYSKFNPLDIKILSRRWNSTGQDLPEDLDGPPVITQVDKSTWSKMPATWQNIQDKINEKRTVKKRSAADSIIEYN